MDLKLKLISNLITQLNSYMIKINDIIGEINNIMNENKVIMIRNSLNSLNDDIKKINMNNYNIINSNTSLVISEKDENNIFLKNTSDKKNVIFKKFGKEKNYIYDSSTPLNVIIRNYLEHTGSLRMPKKPIFLYKGCSLNPNDNRKIGDITNEDLEIIVDYF